MPNIKICLKTSFLPKLGPKNPKILMIRQFQALFIVTLCILYRAISKSYLFYKNLQRDILFTDFFNNLNQFYMLKLYFKIFSMCLILLPMYKKINKKLAKTHE